MQKKPKLQDKQKQAQNDEDSAFEMIELATDDINVLTRAFRIINTICEELSAEENGEELQEDLRGIPEHMMH